MGRGDRPRECLGPATKSRPRLPNAMVTLSDLKEVNEALDAGLVSQADYDDVKRDYLRAKKKALEAKEESQKKELRMREEFQRRKLVAKETFQKRKRDAKLRTSALEAIVKHGASLMSEEQKVDLVRNYATMSGLRQCATKAGPLRRGRELRPRGGVRCHHSHRRRPQSRQLLM